jgi:type IV pilus assembly protein PilX
MFTVASPRKALRKHRGAALITSLLLLVVLTILGITVMQVSRVQERMAGNARDLSTGFEAAEAALRNGEALIRQQAIQPIDCTSSPCNFWAQGTFSSAQLGDIATQTPAWWVGNATQFADLTGGAMTATAANPQYVIEDIGFVRTDGGVETGIDPPAGRQFYQVSGRSTGASGLTDILVQSTYTRKF